MASKFKIGDLVWAKMKGFPAWPGKVIEPKSSVKRPADKKPRHFVFFFGSENYAWVLEETVYRYVDHKEKFENITRIPRGFKEAVNAIEDALLSVPDQAVKMADLPTIDDEINQIFPSKESTRKDYSNRGKKRSTDLTSKTKSAVKAEVNGTRGRKTRTTTGRQNAAIRGVSWQQQDKDKDTPFTSLRDTAQREEQGPRRISCGTQTDNTSITEEGSSTDEGNTLAGKVGRKTKTKGGKQMVSKHATTTTSKDSLPARKETFKGPARKRKNTKKEVQFTAVNNTTEVPSGGLGTLRRSKRRKKPAKKDTHEAIHVGFEQPIKEAVEQPVKEAVEQPVKEAVEQPVKEAAAEQPVKEAVEQPIFEAAVEQPIFEAAVEQPVFEAAVEQPVFEAAVEQPVFEAAVEQPVFEAAVEQPILLIVAPILDSDKLDASPTSTCSADHVQDPSQSQTMLGRVSTSAIPVRVNRSEGDGENATTQDLDAAFAEEEDTDLFDVAFGGLRPSYPLFGGDLFESSSTSTKLGWIQTAQPVAGSQRQPRQEEKEETGGRKGNKKVLGSVYVLQKESRTAIAKPLKKRALSPATSTLPPTKKGKVVVKQSQPKLSSTSDAFDEAKAMVTSSESRAIQREIDEYACRDPFSDPDYSPALAAPAPAKNVIATPMKIGFLGLGIMGTGMVNNLLVSGHEVTVWNRTPSKCREFVKEGALKANSPAEVVQTCDITFSCVSDPPALKDLVFGNCGVLQGIEQGKAFVDMSTVDVETIQDISEAVTARGGRFLEAPVIGSRQPSVDGSLVVLTAGDRSLYEDCYSCFEAMGRKTFYLGEVGSATKMKLVTTMLMGTVLAGLSECLALAEKVGLDQDDVMSILQMSPINCNYIKTKGNAMLSSHYNDPHCKLQIYQKDLRLAVNMSDLVDQPLHVGSAVNELFKKAKAKGYGEHDTAAVYRAAAL